MRCWNTPTTHPGEVCGGGILNGDVTPTLVRGGENGCVDRGEGSRGLSPRWRVGSERDPNKSQRRQIQGGSLGWVGSKNPGSRGSESTGLQGISSKGVHSPPPPQNGGFKGRPTIDLAKSSPQEGTCLEKRGVPQIQGRWQGGHLETSGGFRGLPRGEKKLQEGISTGGAPGEGRIPSDPIRKDLMAPWGRIT